MGTGQLHYDEYIRACDAFGASEITEDEFRRRLERLGYEPRDIQSEIDAANEVQ